jgi:hypothetical protein
MGNRHAEREYGAYLGNSNWDWIKSEVERAKSAFDRYVDIQRSRFTLGFQDAINRRNKFARAIAEMTEKIDSTENYLSSRKNENAELVLSSIKVLRDGYVADLGRYDSFLQPYMARRVVDEAMKEAKKEKMRGLVLRDLRNKGIPEANILDTGDALLVIDQATILLDELNVGIQIYLLPHTFAYKSARPSDVFVDYNGNSLGSPMKVGSAWELEPLEPGRWSSGTSNSVMNKVLRRSHGNYTYNSNDLPRSGKLEVSLIFGDSKYETKIDFETLIGKDREEENNGLEFAERTSVNILEGERRGNHLFFQCSVKINGEMRAIEAMFDSGATDVTVPSREFKRLGKPSNRHTYNTANGKITADIHEGTVSVGEFSRNLDIALMNNDVALLGASFLDGALYAVDLANESIYIMRTPSEAYGK